MRETGRAALQLRPRGCVEAYAGRGALEERARKEARERKTMLFDLMRKRGRDRLTSGIWLRALDAGDEVAGDLLGEAVEALGVGIGSAVTLLDVEAVILGGGLGERLGPRLARSHRASGPRAHVLPRSARVPARRARRPRRRHRREPPRPVRAVLVTGAGRGLGAAIVERLSADGYAVVGADLTGRRRPARRPRSRRLGRRRPRALEAAGEPWALVNCAARTIVRDLYDIEPEEWDDVLATNLRGPFLGIRAIGAAARVARGRPHRQRLVGLRVQGARGGRSALRGVEGGAHLAHAPRSREARADRESR